MALHERLAVLIAESLSQQGGQNVGAALEEIQECLDSEEAIPSLFTIANESSDTKIRNACYVYLRKLLKPLSSEETNDYVSSFRESVLSLFEKEVSNGAPDLVVINSLVNLVEIIIANTIQKTYWPELGVFGLSLFERGYLESGLMYFSVLYEYLEEEVKEEHFAQIAEIAIESFGNSSVNIREKAFEMVNTLCWSAEDMDSLSETIPGIEEAIFSALSSAVERPVEEAKKDITGLYDLLSYLFFDSITCFSDLAIRIFTTTLEWSANEQIPLDIRILLFQIFDEAPQFFADYITENCEDILSQAFALSIEACEADREDPAYMFVSTLLDNAVRHIDTDELYPVISSQAYDFIQSEDEAYIQVGFLLIESIAECCGDQITEESDQIVDLIKVAIQSEDSEIINSANSLLSALAQYVPAALTEHFDDIITMLVENAADSRMLTALEKVLYASDHCYGELSSLLELFLGLLADDEIGEKDSVVRCIYAALEKFSGVDESLFESIYPAISPFLEDFEDQQMIGPAFQVVGLLAKVSPASTQETVESTLEFMLGVLGAEEPDVKSCASVTEALKEFISMFSVSIQPQAAAIAETLLSLIERVENPRQSQSTEEDRDEDEGSLAERDYCSMTGNAILSLGMMIETMPEEMAEYAPKFVELAMSMLKSVFIQQQMSSSIALKHSIPYTFDAGLDPNDLIEKLVEYLSNSLSAEASAQIYRLTAGLISSLTPDFTISHIESIKTLLASVLSGENQLVMNNGGLKALEQTTVPPFFETLNRFVMLCGESLGEYLEEIANPLLEMLEGTAISLRGYAVRIVATLSIYFPEQGLFEAAFDRALQWVQAANPTLKMNCFNALGTLVRANTEAVMPHSQTILSQARAVINRASTISNALYESALCAWCTVNIKYGIVPSTGDINAVFQELQFRKQKNSDHVVAWARFAYFAAQNGVTEIDQVLAKIAAIALSMTEFEVARIGGDAIAFLVSVVGPYADDLTQLTAMNQRKAMLIGHHLE